MKLRKLFREPAEVDLQTAELFKDVAVLKMQTH
jgi:hypothetical protein